MLLFSSMSRADKLALLVGISEYAELDRLQGPEYDVKAIGAALTEKWSFSADNITTLLNGRATKKNILQAIDQLYADSKAGDNIFLYFSGHGTSQFDWELSLPLPYTTGAFIPYDASPRNDADEVLAQLIVGNRDLRPRLAKFDSGDRHLFVVMDACYSGSTVRGTYATRQLPTRYVNLFNQVNPSGQRMPGAQGTASLASRSATRPGEAESNKNNSYPYTNIYYLGAASQYEKAVDISAEWLEDYPTIDGNPHGAFTDSLLRALAKPFAVDVNNNGTVSYMELKQGVNNILQARRFHHTAQGLPDLAQDKYKLNRKNVFFMTPKSMLLASANANTQSGARHSDASPMAATAVMHDPAQVEMPQQERPEGAAVSPTTAIPNANKLPDITFSNANADVRVTTKADEYVFLDPSGDMIYRQDAAKDAAYVNQLKYLKWLDEAQSLLDSAPQEMVGEIQGLGRGSSLREGDTIGITLYPSVDGYLLIVNFTSSGAINLLYPAAREQDIRHRQNTIIRKHDFARVTAPFGRESVYALLFDKRIELPDYLLGASFAYDDEHAAELMQLINKQRRHMRVRKFTFYTAAKLPASE